MPRYFPSVTYEEVVDALIALREEYEWSRPQVSRHLGITRQAMGYWEKMTSRVDLNDMARWANILKQRLIVELVPEDAAPIPVELQAAMAGFDKERLTRLVETARLFRKLSKDDYELLWGFIQQFKARVPGAGEVSDRGTAKPA